MDTILGNPLVCTAHLYDDGVGFNRDDLERSIRHRLEFMTLLLFRVAAICFDEEVVTDPNLGGVPRKRASQSSFMSLAHVPLTSAQRRTAWGAIASTVAFRNPRMGNVPG